MSKQSEPKKRIVIVDDHPVVRQGLAQLIDQEPDMEVCGGAEDIAQALKVIATTKPDIAIVDLSLKDCSGLELIKDIKTRYPKVLILVLSMLDEAFYAERVLRAGAQGYIMKEAATERVVLAMRRILSGQVYLSDAMSSRILMGFVGGKPVGEGLPIKHLSDRELEVFESIGQGMGTRQIAERLHLSIKTIEAHRENIKKKLKLKNATELLRHAIQWVQMEKPSPT
jgi:DNA-binding NarL/FixJ family response regulator